jgi:hypothetical protein
MLSAPDLAQRGTSAEVTIWIDRADVKAITQFVTKRLKNRRSSKVFSWLLPLPVVLVDGAFVFAADYLQDIPIVAVVVNHAPAFVGGAIAFAILLLACIRLSPTQRKIADAKMQRAIGRFHVVINPETITIEDVQGRYIAKWSRFSEIVTTQKHIFLFVDPYYGYIIPRNAFADEEEADQFLDQMRSYHRLATTS